MLQIGRFLCRGQGAMLVTGPLGAALVPLDFADSAADVVWGRADTQAWLSHVQAERGDVLLLDCAGEQPYLTVLGNIQLRMRAAGQITEQVWTDPIWAWPFNPGEWQTFEATIIEGDEVTWMVPAADRVEAAEIRIGRALDEVEALASMPVDTMGFLINPDIPDHERRARREAREELPEPSLHTSSVDLAAVEAQFLAATSNGPVSLTPSTRTATPAGDEAPEKEAQTPEDEAPEPVEETTERDAEQPSGELYVVADAEEPPVDTAESAERAGGFGESGAPASSEAWPAWAPRRTLRPRSCASPPLTPGPPRPSRSSSTAAPCPSRCPATSSSAATPTPAPSPAAPLPPCCASPARPPRSRVPTARS